MEKKLEVKKVRVFCCARDSTYGRYGHRGGDQNPFSENPQFSNTFSHRSRVIIHIYICNILKKHWGVFLLCLLPSSHERLSIKPPSFSPYTKKNEKKEKIEPPSPPTHPFSNPPPSPPSRAENEKKSSEQRGRARLSGKRNLGERDEY